MSILTQEMNGTCQLMMGNDAIARGAVEAGINVAAAYPGTPSSEIIANLAKAASKKNLYVEWAVNEKVALEVAVAGSFAGLRSLAVMKQPGINVASDFLLHLAGSGTRGGMVLVGADDPGALSSVNEGETRFFARQMEIPLLEPGNFQEAKDMVKWAFDLSETIKNLVLVRTVTRLSHASGLVTLGKMKDQVSHARFKHKSHILDPENGPMMSTPVGIKHIRQQEKLEKAVELFEHSPFNVFQGPEKAELLIVTSSICDLYAKEAVKILDLENKVGILKLGTTWPLPPTLLEKHLKLCDQVLILEEVLPFLEEQVKILAAEKMPAMGMKRFFGKNTGEIPLTGEMNPDIVIQALTSIFKLDYSAVDPAYQSRAADMAAEHAPGRETTFCPGCPHRASFFSINKVLDIDNRDGFTCGDIGCYSLAMLSGGFFTLKTLHAMGSGTGLASGFGKLGQFGMDQPAISVCGDSTFFHAAMPALANAIHNKSNIVMVILDNSGTAMTGFQPHPGLPTNALGHDAPDIDIPSVAKAMGARVTVCDPFDLDTTQETLLNLLQDRDGAKVLVLKQVCALSPEKKNKKRFNMTVDSDKCIGEACGCARMCTRVFKCPGLIWDKDTGQSKINEVICTGCGVCASVCPAGAIIKEEA